MNDNLTFDIITNYVCIIFISLMISYMLYNQVYEYYAANDPMIISLKNKLSPVFPDIVSMNIYSSTGKSYTINKEKVYICLKDKNNNYYNEQALMYVLLHEYCHCKCNEIGHTPKFHKMLEYIIKQASDAGVYNIDIQPESNYCEHKS